MRRSRRLLLAMLTLALVQCAERGPGEQVVVEGASPMFDSMEYAAVSARLRDSFVLRDTAFCDSVLPLFDDPILARVHPHRVVGGFVSNLIGHEAHCTVLIHYDPLETTYNLIKNLIEEKISQLEESTH